MQAQTLPYRLCLEAAKGLLCLFRHHDKLLPEVLNQGRDNRVSLNMDCYFRAVIPLTCQMLILCSCKSGSLIIFVAHHMF